MMLIFYIGFFSLIAPNTYEIIKIVNIKNAVKKFKTLKILKLLNIKNEVTNLKINTDEIFKTITNTIIKIH